MASDTLSTSSYLDRLPDELWLEVLGSLSYFDLKRARSVCKRMDGWFKVRVVSSAPYFPG